MSGPVRTLVAHASPPAANAGKPLALWPGRPIAEGASHSTEPAPLRWRSPVFLVQRHHRASFCLQFLTQTIILAPMAAVQIHLGSLFTGKSDLVVLPCSAKGTITKGAQGLVDAHKLDRPPTGMQLGDVRMFKYPGSGTITTYYAWAASVLNDATTEAAIERIGYELGSLTRTHADVKLIQCAPVGTGHGGLDMTIACCALRKGFLSSAVGEAALLILKWEKPGIQEVADA